MPDVFGHGPVPGDEKPHLLLGVRRSDEDVMGVAVCASGHVADAVAVREPKPSVVVSPELDVLFLGAQPDVSADDVLTELIPASPLGFEDCPVTRTL